jgi:hypothetical protein
VNKYTRKQINIKAHLHDKSFVTVEDAASALTNMVEMAIECGADASKLLVKVNKTIDGPDK